MPARPSPRLEMALVNTHYPPRQSTSLKNLDAERFAGPDTAEPPRKGPDATGNAVLIYALAAFNLILLIAVVLLSRYVVKTREQRKQRGLLRPWPIPRVSVEELDEAFRPGPFGPTLRAEVRFIGRGDLPVHAGTSDFEAWILAVLSKKAENVFEFGTGTGKTAYLMAVNSLPNGRVTTLTIGPDQGAEYKDEEGDDRKLARAALEEAAFSQFLYTGAAAEAKIHQLFEDSKEFDETPYLGRCDLVFIDGAHTYSYIKSDSEKALRMVKPGGIVLWHDYHGPGRAKDVFRALNELAESLPLLHIAGTNLVAYRRPPGAT